MNQVDGELLLRFLSTRRTIRRFRPDPLPRALLEQLLTVAAFAPSAHDLQPWRFVVLESAASRERLGAALTAALRRDMEAEGATEAEIQARCERSRRRLRQAPAVVLLCREQLARRGIRPEEELMGIQSVAAAGLQLLLAAHALGLGGNWICWPLYAQRETQVALSLPEFWQPEAMFFLGYADESPALPSRIPQVVWR